MDQLVSGASDLTPWDRWSENPHFLWNSLGCLSDDLDSSRKGELLFLILGKFGLRDICDDRLRYFGISAHVLEVQQGAAILLQTGCASFST